MTLAQLLKQLTDLKVGEEGGGNDEVYAVFPKEHPRRVQAAGRYRDRILLYLDRPDDVR